MKNLENILEIRSVTKRFGTFFANKNISFGVKKSTIHGLLGENGAGKTTLMSVLFGLYKKDNGQILINGKEVNIKNPIIAQKNGIGMVHQHFKLVDNFNAIENITLGREITKNAFVSKKSSKKEIVKIAQKYKFNVDLKKPVENLNVSQKQKIEILKLLYLKCSILIFDEPTAVLSPLEIENFMKILRKLKRENKTIILISHKLNEIKGVCDYATILRKGECIKTVSVKETSGKQISNLILGKVIHETTIKEIKVSSKVKNKDKKNVIKVEKLTSKNKKIKDINFEVQEGEIVGIAGVEGNGQNELVHALMGSTKLETGQIHFTNEKKPVNITKKTIRNRIENGISFILEDRHKFGLVLDFEVYKNLILNNFYQKNYAKNGFIKWQKVIRNTQKVVTTFDIRGASNGFAKAKNLSGGNQQKLVFGKEMCQDFKLYVVCQPTRGLDIGSSNKIHEFLFEKKQKQKSVLLVSYDLDELFACTDRILVFWRGQIVGNFPNNEKNKKEIGRLMLNGK